MKKELVSIIIPVYNAEKYLKRCIDAVISQSYKNLEIILIDDGSTDLSGKICDDYQKKDKRIKVIHKVNEGAGSARNYGLDAAKGKYIGFVDADDVIDKDMFLILYNNLINNDADLSICEVTRFKDNAVFTKDNTTIIYNSFEALKVLLEDKKICSYSVNKLCKREILKNVSYPTKTVQEDVGTVYKFIMNARKIVYTPSKLYGYYMRNSSVTNTITPKFIYDNFNMIEQRSNNIDDPKLAIYLKLNKANVILGTFIDLAQNRKLLKDQKLNSFMQDKFKELKNINEDIKIINTKKHNILIRLLLFNPKLFFSIMNLYLKIKRCLWK